MRFSKRYIAAFLGVVFLLFWAIKLSLEWRREFVSAAESIRQAQAALREGDAERSIHYLDEAVSRSSLDQEELSSAIFRLLTLLDGAPPMPLSDAARLHRYRLDLQRRNCQTQSWQKPLSRSIADLGLGPQEARNRFNLLHPGWERIDSCTAEAEMLGTFAAWQRVRSLAKELKKTGSVNETVLALGAIGDLRTRELDALGLETIPAAPIIGWARTERQDQPANPELLRVLAIGLAVPRQDARLASDRSSSLAESVALADAFAEKYPRSVSGQVSRIEARVRGAEQTGAPFLPTAQDLLEEFSRSGAGAAGWREILRVANLQLRNMRLLDAGSGEQAQAAVVLRRLTGILLERDPGAPDALLILGRMCRRLGQPEEAREYFRRAEETVIQTLPSQRAQIWDLAVGLASIELADMDLTDRNADLDSVDRRVTAAAARLGENQGDVLLVRGRIALRRNRPREGIRLLEEACKRVGTTRPEALYHSGMALAGEGETGIAAERLGIFLNQRGTRPEQNLEASRSLAALFLQNLPASEAAQSIAELCARYPDDGELALARARAVTHVILQTNTEPYARAAGLETVRGILRSQLAAGREEALLQAAVTEATLGNEEDSLKALAEFCRERPRHEEGILAWCWALRRRGDLVAEEQVVRELVLPHTPETLADLLRRALARESGPRDQLQPMLQLAFTTDPVEQQLGLFWLHWSLGESEACEESLKAGFALASNHPGLLAAKLAYLLDTGQAGAARTFLANLPAEIPEWQRQLWQAKLALAVRDLPAAEHMLNQLVARQPHLSEALALQGKLARLQDRTAVARLRYRESLDVSPRQIIALEGIADICLDEHEPVMAFGFLRQLVRLASPEQPRFESLMLEHLAQSGTAATAIRFREQRRQRAPWDRANRIELALLHLNSQQGGQAAETLRQLHGEDTGDLAIAILLARVLLERGERQEARRLLVSSGAAAEAGDGRMLELAELLASSGAREEARTVLARAAEGEGGTATAARFRLADLLFDEREWAEAAAAYGSCPGAERRPDLLLRQAECTIRSGNLDMARERLATLRRMVPDHPLVAVLDAEVFLETGDREKATAACDRALELDPGCAAAHFQRARIRLQAGDGEETLALACADLEKACVRDPGQTAARELLVRLLLERERPDEAVAALQMLVAARPAEHRLKEALGELLLVLGRKAALTSQLRIWRGQHPGAAFVWRLEGLLAQSEGDDRGAAQAFARHAAETGEPESVLKAVDSYLAAGFSEEARRVCAPFDSTVAAPEILAAKARVAAADEARGLLASAFASVRDDRAAIHVLEQARQALPPAELLAWLLELRERNPSRVLALALARLWEENGQPTKAAELLRALAGESAGEERALLLSRVAAAELAVGETAKAEASLREALELVPGHPALLNNAAHMALGIPGREAEAVRLSRQAVASSADNRELHACALATLAESLFALRLYDQAREALKQALAIQETAEDRFLLGRTLLASGRADLGNAQLRRARELAEREGKAELARRIGELL